MSDSPQLDSHTRSLTPPADTADAAAGRAERVEDQFDATSSLLRLLVGGALVGADEVRYRLQVWEAATRATTHPASHHAQPQAAPEALRYALIGMLFESEARVRRGFSRMLARMRRLSEEAHSHDSYYYDSYYIADTPDMIPTPLDPLLMRLDELLDELRFNATTTIDRWSARGRIEEQHGRRMARLATVSVIDELLDYMARNPQVRQLIEKQATGMAGTAVEEVQGRTAQADMWVERLAHGLLRRPMNNEVEEPANNAEPLPTNNPGG